MRHSEPQYKKCPPCGQLILKDQMYCSTCNKNLVKFGQMVKEPMKQHLLDSPTKSWIFQRAERFGANIKELANLVAEVEQWPESDLKRAYEST